MRPVLTVYIMSVRMSELVLRGSLACRKRKTGILEIPSNASPRPEKHYQEPRNQAEVAAEICRESEKS